MAVSQAEGQRPVIIVGTGRCGSTFLHRVMALHDELGWLSTFNETFPRQHWLSAFSRLYRTPLPDRIKLMKAFPKPFEAYRFWESYLPASPAASGLRSRRTSSPARSSRSGVRPPPSSPTRAASGCWSR